MKAIWTHSKMKTDFTIRSAVLESTIVTLVWRMCINEVFITDQIMMEKERKTQAEINDTVPEQERTHLSFSNGWLSKFKSQNRFKRYRNHGESGNPDYSAIRAELPILQALLSEFSRRDTLMQTSLVSITVSHQSPPSDRDGFSGGRRKKIASQLLLV